MKDEIIKSLSKKYNKKENILLIMIHEARKSGYDLSKSAKLIDEFYIMKKKADLIFKSMQ